MSHGFFFIVHLETKQQPPGLRNEDNLNVPKTAVISSGWL